VSLNELRSLDRKTDPENRREVMGLSR